MKNSFLVTRPTSRRRRLAGLLAAGAASAALTVSLGPAQLASAHTDSANGSPGTFDYKFQYPSMLTVGSRDTATGPVATFTAGMPYVTSADVAAHPQQMVEASYTLQSLDLFTRGASWVDVETKMSLKFLANGEAGFVSGATFNTTVAHVEDSPGHPGGKLYRIRVYLTWVDDSTGKDIGVRQALPSVSSELVCASGAPVQCGIARTTSGTPAGLLVR